jgi:hypothetical protein
LPYDDIDQFLSRYEFTPPNIYVIDLSVMAKRASPKVNTAILSAGVEDDRVAEAIVPSGRSLTQDGKDSRLQTQPFQGDSLPELPGEAARQTDEACCRSCGAASRR